MNIKREQPPNIHEIRQYLKPDENAVFAWGDTIFAPSGQEIPEDILFHESVHAKQQKGWILDVWWTRYCMDKAFRLRMELEAYHRQLQFLKDIKDDKGHRVFSAKALNEALEEMATQLSSPMYNLGISFHRAQTLIRKYDLAQ